MLNKKSRCRHGVLGASLLLILLSAGSTLAQHDISGHAVNQSLWRNAELTPPGDGTGAGALMIGVWGAEGEIVGPPMASTEIVTTAVLPFAYNQSHAYTLGPLNPGSYRIVAWIDGDANSTFDLGEPASLPVGVTIEDDDIAGINIAVIDDRNGNGMADWWEMHWFGDLNTANPNGDYDNDGLTDLEEFQIAMSHPSLITLSPVNWDTSGDGMDDGWKWQYYRNGAGLHPCLDEADDDPDGDGLTNIQEYRGTDGIPRMRQDPTKDPGIGMLTGSDNSLDPLDIDTSDDGLIDSFGFAWYDPGYGIDPLAAGDPGADPDRDGLTNFQEQSLHAPLREGGANAIWVRGPGSLPLRNLVTGIRAFDPPLDFAAAGLVELVDVVYALRDNADWTKPSNGSGYDFDHLPGTAWNISHFPGWDTDGDGLPDGWEVEFGLDPRDGELLLADGFGGWIPNPNSFLGDPDGDGLVNIQEYYGQDGMRADEDPYIHGSGDETNPNQHAWWHNLINPRQPALPSASSFAIATRLHAGGLAAGPFPAMPLGWDSGYDTADNDIPDHQEVQDGTSPVHSMDPFRMRSARITDAAGIVIPDPLGSPANGYRPDLVTRSWTLESWVKLNSSGRSGDLVLLPRPIDDHGALTAFTARLALSNDVPLVAFQTIGGKEYRLEGMALAVGQWSHVAGVWDPDNNALTLYVDGIFEQSVQIFEECVSTYQYAMIAPPRLAVSDPGPGGFANQLRMDEVRIWGVARTPDQIEAYRQDLVNPYAAEGDLLAYFRFDDGGASAEDFTRKARSSLIDGADYLFGDYGYALTAGSGFEFDVADFAVIYGVDSRGADDSSGDGMPDPWKLVNHLDIFSAAGNDGRDGDPDGDGLSNIYEYWARTNPRKSDTTGNSIPDAWEDPDGDGVPNIIEQYYGTRPDMVDTDNNGFTDAEEIAMGTDPTNPLDPLISRAMQFGGAAGDYLEIPIQAKQRLSAWTLEAWVRPEPGADGMLVRRTVQRLPGGQYAANWRLAVQPAGAGEIVGVAGFTSLSGVDYDVISQPFAAGEWTHLAASYNPATSLLSIYINGVKDAEVNVLMASPPVNGKGGEAFTRIGEAFEGAIDEVRIWSLARPAASIQAAYDRHLNLGEDDLVHYFRFDDGQANENVVPFGEFHQPYGPQDFTQTEDWHNQWRHAAVMHGNAGFSEPGAIVAAPALRVILLPADVVDNGAQWSMNEGPWMDSGVIAQNLDRDNLSHFITYQAIPGWQAPDAGWVDVTNGVLTTVTRSYVRYGTLTVTLGPAAARTDGAQWNVNGGAWMDSGASVQLPPGSHTVGYRPIAGWDTPVSDTVMIVSEQSISLSRVYTGIFVSGQVVNESRWDNSILTPPGDGSGGGSMIVGIWAAGTAPDASPLYQAVVETAPAGTLPLPYEATYAFSMGPLPVGNYRISAWIDGDGNGIIDLGEPHSPADELILGTESVTGLELKVNDDSDEDGMADWWEVYWFGDLETSDGSGDYDSDGLTDLEEFIIWTNMVVTGAWTPGMPPLSPKLWDSSGDLLPDGWKVEFGLNPCDGDLMIPDGLGGWIPNPHGFLGDPDGDGLINYQEFLGADGQRDPVHPYVLGTGDETNPNEYTWQRYAITARPWPHYLPSATNFWSTSTLPALAGRSHGLDTSDNTISDADAIRAGTSPVHSMDPFIMRSARITDAAGIELPDPSADAGPGYRPDLISREWTLEMWVRFDTAGVSGDLIYFPGPVDAQGANVAFTARLALDNDAPRLAFQTVSGHEYAVTGLPLPAGYWTHLAGVWDPENNALSLYVNGVMVQSLNVFEECVSLMQYAMRSPPRLADSSAHGGAFVDNLNVDEVRIWSVARTDVAVEALRSDLACQYHEDLLAYFRFDDGGLTAEDFTRKAFSRLRPGIVRDIQTTNFNATVTIEVRPPPGVLSWTYVEHLAEGLGLVSSFGTWNATDRTITGTRNGDAPDVLMYTVAFESEGRYPVSGTATFDGIEGTVTGEREITFGLFDRRPFPRAGEFLYGDFGYALPAGVGFVFDDAEYALVHGVDARGADDSSGDGMPDPWKMVNHLDVFSGDGDDGPYGDPDGDGIWNIYEYWAGTNPREADTFGDGILDAARDIDGDGLTLLQEQQQGTHPRLPDTADNGLLDGDLRDPRPVNSLMPEIDRVLRLDGSPGSYVAMPDQARFALSSWTLQAWVMPTNATSAGTVITRRMQNDVVNYHLAVTAEGYPRIMFTAGMHTTNLVLTGNRVLQPDTWTHLAASFNTNNGSLRLLMNGEVIASQITTLRPALNGIGPVRLRAGEGWAGYLDEVAIFNHALTTDKIAASMNGLAIQSDLNGLVLFYRFDDGTSATGPDAAGRWYGTSGNTNWWWGQVEDFTPGLEQDWRNQWRNAGTLAGQAFMVSLTEDSAMPLPPPVAYADADSNDDGISDWWYIQYGFDPDGPSVADDDPDGDGLSNYWEYRLGSDPFNPRSLDPQGILTDGEWDSDGDGLSNWDEIHVYGTDPTLYDTADNGYSDGDEVSDTFVDLQYGFSYMSTDPLNARSPLIRRSLILNGNHLVAPYGERFSLIPEEDGDSDGPLVTLTQPIGGASLNVRFVEVVGSVQSIRPLQTIRLLNNSLFVQNLSPDADGNFSVTVIITAGENLLEVLAIDEDGGAGRASVRITGDFPRADIRVTQTWDQPGDLDTWLVDPQGRHMGWTTGGPGYPNSIAARIPDAFLDIDDIPGTGPENITVEQGAAIAGQYEVWMNNYSHQGNPNSMVRVLVHDGAENQQYVEFGPHPMPVADNNGTNLDAWWHVTTISWPSGQMDPPGRTVSGAPAAGGGDGAGDAEISLPGWTIEAWIKPVNDQQSGAIASYLLPDGRLPYVVGLTNNRPFVRIRSMGGTEYLLDAAPLPSNTWNHLAFVYSEQEKIVRLLTNGFEAASRGVPLPVLKGVGEMTVDTGFAMPDGAIVSFDAAYLDELRFWSRARGAGSILGNMHRHVAVTPALLAYYYFDDGGLGIEDGVRPRDREYDLGGWPLPDVMTDAKPGPDGIWGTADDVATDPGPGQGDGHNDFVIATQHAPVLTGSLSVIIEPPGAVLANAAWRVAGGNWRESGDVIENLDLGSYPIEFLEITPWTMPESMTAYLTANHLVTVTGRYTHVSGVQIVIEPSAAVVAGAAWRFAGETTWRACGQFVERTPGTYTIEFKELNGWLTPGSFTTTVSNEMVNTYIRAYYLLETVGVPGSNQAGQFRFPRGLALDADRKLYVADSGNNRVQVRDPVSGNWTVLGSAGSAPGQFHQPFGVTIDSAGRVYVADANNHRIQRFDPATGTWLVWGGPSLGTDLGQFNGPFDVAIDAQDNIYVADHYNHRVQKRSPNGIWTELIPPGFGDNQTRLPSGLAIVGNHLIVADYVAQTGVSRVRRFDTNGTQVDYLPGDAENIALNKPRSPFAVDDASMLLADMVNNRVLRFDADAGRWEVLVGGSSLSQPEGVAMDAPGFIYIADTANHRLLRLGMSGATGQQLSPYSTAYPGRMSAAAPGADGFVVRWRGKAGWLYVIQYRDSIVGETGWQPLPGVDRIMGYDGIMEVVDPDPPPKAARFYRIQAY